MNLHNSLRSLALVLMMSAGAAYAADAAKPADAPTKPAMAKKSTKKMAKKPKVHQVVYHINEGIDQAVAGMRNAKNHLASDPTAKIVFVGHAKGIDFLLKDAKDSKGNDMSKSVEALALQGVEFRVCNNTLVGRKIDPNQVISDAQIVPAGVVEITNLQNDHGYAYVKP